MLIEIIVAYSGSACPQRLIGIAGDATQGTENCVGSGSGIQIDGLDAANLDGFGAETWSLGSGPEQDEFFAIFLMKNKGSTVGWIYPLT